MSSQPTRVTRQSCGGRRARLAALGALLALLVSPVSTTAAPSGSAERGTRLFTGTARFASGGPACGSCHQNAGLSFPYGGSLGPELQSSYRRMGPAAMSSVLETLFFPVMTPLYSGRPLSPEERASLLDFFAATSDEPAAPDLTGAFALSGLCGLLLLVGAGALVWRRRLHGVRRSLVADCLRRQVPS